MRLWLTQGGWESFTLPWCRHIYFTQYQTGRGIGTETCWVNDVFPPDDLMFSALVLKLALIARSQTKTKKYVACTELKHRKLPHLGRIINLQ